MRVFGAWIVVQLIAALAPDRALATPYVLADPRVDPTWGRPGQPTAPSAVREADSEIAASSPAADWAARYMEQLQASPPTLDAAAAFHFYAPPNTLRAAYLGQRPAPSIGAATLRMLDEKGRAAEPALVQELDRRFEALATAVRGADSIVLPETINLTERPASYCRWIGEAAGGMAVPLANRLREHCLGRRDQFIGALVDRIADLATIPALPGATGATWNPATWNPDALRLSYLVLPGETRAPMDYAALEARLEQRLGQRFEARRAELEAQLGLALERRAASGVVLPPVQDCAAILGPYASVLARSPAAAEIAGELQRACMERIPVTIAAAVQRVGDGIMAGLKAEADRVQTADVGDTRVDRTPQATCDALLTPHFPATRAVYGDAATFPSAPRLGVLGRACLAAATDIRRAVLNKHLTAALAGLPARDAVGAWASAAWFAVPPGGGSWIDGRADPAALASFEAAYEPAVAPRRKEAAVKAADVVSGPPDDMAGAFPDGDPCVRRQRSPGDTALGSLLGLQPDPVAEARRVGMLRAKPALSASEAEELLTLTCRAERGTAVAAHTADAERAAGLDRTLAQGERLAVPRHEDGSLMEVDALALVRGAAADGIQVAFDPGGMFSGPSLTVAPLDTGSQQLQGALHEEKEDDGTRLLVIRSLDPLPGLHTPEETVTCLLTPVDQAAGEARLNAIGAIAGGMFSEVPELHGHDIRDAMARGTAVEACRAAKARFTGRAGSAVR